MKKVLLLVYLLLMLELFWPAREESPALKPGSGAEETSPAPAAPTAAPGEPAPERIRLLVGEAIREMDMQEYLCGVLAAEMPASFPLEALKAQAVAARTYTLYCAGRQKHDEAQICSDPGCCQAWQSEEKQREKWGENYGLYAQKIASAVEATEGEYLQYEGQAVFAAFHSSSAGATEACGDVWNPLPYLLSVESPETAEDVPGYVSELLLSPLDFRDSILSICPEADFTGPEAEWIGAIQHSGSGRVDSIVLGGQSLGGSRLRTLFSLRSTAFQLDYVQGLFRFTVTGYGHGVGMSQYGAKVMAENGTDYRSILAHYYPGTYLS